MPVTPETNTCQGCAYWIRLDSEHGHCMRYAPSPIPVVLPEKVTERPITHQYTVACGDWKKKV